MLHQPAALVGKDPAQQYKMRVGVWMVLAYSLFYAGFVAINLLRPMLMEQTVWAGLNLATVYGMALIIIALLQALVYDGMCRAMEHKLETRDAKEEVR